MFFIDFEATDKKEIISVGVVDDATQKTFYSLVKPQVSTLTPFISSLTGLRPADLETADTFYEVFSHLYDWCIECCPDVNLWKFFSFGKGDKKMIETTVAYYPHNMKAWYMAQILMGNISNCDYPIKKYFRGTISLIKAYNYLKSQEEKQKHNALEDAMMLNYVYNAVKDREPLAENPLANTVNMVKTPFGKYPEDFVFPTGKFYCCGKGKNATVRSFDSISDAIDWLVDTYQAPKDKPNARRDKIAINIMSSMREESLYKLHHWWREK